MTTSQLEERVSELETELEKEREQRRKQVGKVREENRELREELQEEREQRRDVEETVEKQSKLIDALRNRTSTNVERISEIQSREIEKGAHLLEENVDELQLEIEGDLLEKISKEDGRQYVRLPDEVDPLNRGGTTALSTADLLPVQQLARFDDDRLRGVVSALPTRLAVKAWRDRNTDDPRLWKEGSKNVRQYFDASNLKTWIKIEEKGVSDDYAKKLVDRTINALLDLSQNRLGVEMRKRRKDGLRYKERRVVLKADVDVPGETAPETNVVGG